MWHNGPLDYAEDSAVFQLKSSGRLGKGIYEGGWAFGSCSFCCGRGRGAGALRRRGGAAQQSRRGADGPAIYERAAESFAAALKKDPKLAQAAVNEGIALLTLQRLDEAKKALEQGLRSTRIARRRGTTWAWPSTRATN